MPKSCRLHQQLISLAHDSTWLMPMLVAARELDLPDWCIGAGTIRNLVWDALHGYSTPSALADVDVAYFDGRVWDAADETALQARLHAILPGVAWEVTNQATVHLWFEAYFGYPVAPLTSLEEAVASWPEYATAVGMRLEANNTLSVIAPYGLEDLFAMRVRRNPSRVSVGTYRERIAQKRYAERWPGVQIVAA